MFLWNFCHLFQCCFISATQVLMTVSNYYYFFSSNHFLERSFTFQWGVSFLRGRAPQVPTGGEREGINFDGGISKKIMRWGAILPCPPYYGKPWVIFNKLKNLTEKNHLICDFYFQI